MQHKQLAARIELLEKSLSQFAGVDWIARLGEVAEIKIAFLDMTEDTALLCTKRLNAGAIARIDRDLALLAAPRECARVRARAFAAAYHELRECLAPALPPRASSVRR